MWELNLRASAQLSAASTAIHALIGVKTLTDLNKVASNYAFINDIALDSGLDLRTAHRWHLTLSVFVPTKTIIFILSKQVQGRSQAALKARTKDEDNEHCTLAEQLAQVSSDRN